MIVYIDTSVVIRYLLNDPLQYNKFGKWEKGASSILLEIEGHRTIDRLRFSGEITDKETSELKSDFKRLLKTIDIISLNTHILERSMGSYPIPIRTLDALHLASAELWANYIKKPIALLSHDKQMILAAKSIGLETVGTE